MKKSILKYRSSNVRSIKIWIVTFLLAGTLSLQASTGFYTSSQVATLKTDLAAGTHDIYELTTSGGDYSITGNASTNLTIGGTKNPVIRATDGLDTKPVIRLVGNTSSNGGLSILNTVVPNITVTFEGIEFNGINTETIQPIMLYCSSSATDCQVVMRDCYIHNFTNSALNGIIRIDGAGSSISIESSKIGNCSGRLLNFYTMVPSSASVPAASANYGSISLKNSTFSNISGASSVIFYRYTSSNGAVGTNATIDHCTFYNFTTTTSDGIFKFKQMTGSINVTNCIFDQIALGLTTSAPNPNPTINYCYLAGFATPPMGTNTFSTSPVYVGASTLNFGLSNKSSFLCEDGTITGDTSSYIATPTVGVATEIESDNFTANWTAVANASSYEVKVYQGANLISTTNASGQATSSLSISGLNSITSYTYIVLAKGDLTTYCDSDPSPASASFTTIPSINQYSSTTVAALKTDMAAGTYDIYELTTSGGSYVFTSGLIPTKSLILRAANGLASKPILTWSSSSSNGNNSFFAPVTTNLTIEIDGLEFNGINGSYGAQAGLINAQSVSATNCHVVLKDCYIHDFANTTNGMIQYRSAGGSADVQGCVFNNCTYRMFYFYSYVNFGDIVLKNNTFNNISGADASVIYFRYQTGYNAIGANATIDHCTFRNYSTPSVKDGLFVFKSMTGAINVTNCIFDNIARDFVSTPTATIDYCYLAGFATPPSGTNIFTTTPIYVDQATLNFGLSNRNSFRCIDNSIAGNTSSYIATPTLGLTTAIGNAGFTANWIPVANASGYDVNVYQGANLMSTNNASGQSAVNKIISGLASNSIYTYNVVAIGDGVTFNNSDPSVSSTSITTVSPKTTINTNAILRIDSTNCYIIDNFLSNSWGNTTLMPGYGSTSSSYMNTTWLGATTAITKPAMYKDTLANIDGVALNYTLLKGRTGNFDNHLGILNLKDLYLAGNTLETYKPFEESHVQSYLQLPTLPSVGKIILYILPAYGSTGCVVESQQTDGSWSEVAQFSYPIAAKYISLDTLANNKIVSQTPVTYRIRSLSYNTSTSHGYGPMLGAIMVQKYIPNDIRPPYNDRPYYSNPYSAGVISVASSLVCTYNESQWLDLVPIQAPRSSQFSPANVNNISWTWNPATPNQITCDASGKVFPNAEYPISYASIKVMTGKIVNVPYYSTTKGVTYVQAQIDYQKTSFLTSNLPILSAAYRLTGDEKYARYVALALDKWANVVPDYFMTEAWNKTTLVDSSQLDSYRSTISFVQRASDHNGLVHEFHDGEILAYDGIYNSKALQALSVEKGYDVQQHISNDLFLNIALWLKNQPTMDSHAGTNLVGHIGVMLRVAAICADSVTKESIIDFVDRYYTVVIGRNFKRDGMFPESFSYHIGYVNENYANTLLLDNYFKLFPPKTAFQDTIASRSAERVAFTKRTTLVQDSVAFPNGDLAPFDDTAAGYSVVRNSTKSYLLPAYSHAMLGAGIGTQQIQSNIGANDKANHIGNSMMSMTLYAFGKEQIGDIRYSRIPGRNFTNSVQAHNLVAIDQDQSQYYSSGRQVFGNDGHVFTNGYFTMFEDGMDGVSTTEVYSNTINPGTVSRYQRLHLLNTIDAGMPYLIDVFAVKGGTTHDYILNGSTQVAQTATSSLPLVSINNTYPLLPVGATYTDPVFLEDETNWYGAFRNMSSTTSTGNWNVTFQDSLAGGIKVFAVDDATPTVYLGTSPYPYRRTCATNMYAYSRPALIERRIGANSNSKSVFVHVIEAYGSTTSGIASVSKLPLTSASDEYVALSIVFNNGREDVVMINLNNDLITGTATTQTIQTADSVYSLTGKIGLFTNINSSVNGYLIKGSKLSYIDNELNIPDSVYTGTITETIRKADGATYNALVTDATIPEGDDLKGNWISLRFGTYSVINPPSNITTQGNMNELFKIEGVRMENGKTYILCTEDHQLSINGNVTSELLRPQRVFNGATTFKIEKSATYSDINGQQNRIKSNTRIDTIEKNAGFIITPNPVTSHFNVKYNLDVDSNVELAIFNLNGLRISTLVDNQKQLKGNHIKVFEASNLKNGIYFIRLSTGNQSKMSKIIVNK